MLESSKNAHFWENVRLQFDLDPAYAHFALAALASHPKIVRESIDRYRREVDRNPIECFMKKDQLNRQVLEKAASYLVCQPDELSLTESTTMGLSVVFSGFLFQPGQEILTTEHEHYAAAELLRFKALNSGVQLRKISLYSDPRNVTVGQIVDTLLHHITNHTRMIALTWVHSGTGVKIPISEIGARIKEINHNRSEEEAIILCVDGVHGLGIENFAIRDLNCDFFVAGCHKSLCGPRGTGIVWGSERGWNQVMPIMTSFDHEAFWPWFMGKLPEASCPKARFCNPGGFTAFEHRWALEAAFEYQMQIGKAAIHRRIIELSQYCKDRMVEIDKVAILTPNNQCLSSCMIAFEVDGLDPAIVVERLLQEKVVTLQTPYQKSCNRFSIGIANNHADIDKAVEALKKIRA